MNVIQPDIKQYEKSNFPPPASLTGSIDYGIRRSTQRGFPDQGRFYGSNPGEVVAEFRMTVELFRQWSVWMQLNAISRWILLPAPTHYNEFGGTAPLKYTIVRLIDFAHTSLGGDFISVTARFDTWPKDVSDADWGVGGAVSPPLEIGEWIIAKDPADPALDWFIAKTPDDLPLDTVVAGNPADHNDQP